MAAMQRRGPAKTELEMMDTTEDRRNTEQKLHDDCNEETMEIEHNSEGEFKQIKTPSGSRVTSGRYSTTECDVCKATKDVKQFLYCPVCTQKFCKPCAVIHDRLGSTRNHSDSTENCWIECGILDRNAVDRIMKEKGMNLEQVALYIIEELGVQVCYLYDDGVLEIRTPFSDVLELAIATVYAMSEPGLKSMAKRVRHGTIEWTLQEQCANAVIKLFQNEIKALIETYDVVVKMKRGCEDLPWPLQRPGSTTEPNSMVTRVCKKFSHIGNETMELIISSSFENYYAVDCEIDGIKDEAQTLLQAEILREKQDAFRMHVYVMLHENSDVVICHVEKLENVQRLVVQGRETSAVENVKEEFLSLFCKECSSCHEESSRPMFLDCKHVLCNDCVTKSASLKGGMVCPLCCDRSREKTPVSSLQLQCIQVIDQLIDKDSSTNRPVDSNIFRRKSSVRTRQLSTKIPKYLLNKWKKMTGGLSRLKSLIENNYGFKVAGTDDNIRIYGQQQEILELAVQSLERLNEKTPETGITQRLAEKCVEWRLRGDHARIAQFLFHKELNDLKNKFKTVTIQAFTESEPTIVDVKCGYREFLKVRYEMEELENDVKNLFTDECIQPKNFYHNVKIKEYLQSKRRDDKVHCTFVEKNNLNAVVIRGRKKEYVNAAKEQLLKW